MGRSRHRVRTSLVESWANSLSSVKVDRVTREGFSVHVLCRLYDPSNHEGTTVVSTLLDSEFELETRQNRWVVSMM